MEENKSKKRKGGGEASTYYSIPPDTIFEILTRLPIKSLARFISVSKQWFFTISYDPQFLKKHLFRANKDPKLTHCVKGHGSHSILVSRPFSPSTTEVEDRYIISFPSPVYYSPSHTEARAEILSSSCNGLVLVGTGEKDHFLCNPYTRSYRRIPDNFHHFRDFIRMYGLGYDPSTHTYKVIRVVRVVSGFDREQGLDPYHDYYHPRGYYDSTQVRVYNSGTNSWKRMGEFPYKVFANQQGLLVNGAPHWIVGRAKIREYVIIYFDLVEDKFKELESPSWLVLDSFFQLRVSSQGFLCLNRGLEVWAMKEYGAKESWTKLTNKTKLRVDCGKKVFDKAECMASLVSVSPVSPHIEVVTELE